MRRMGGFVQGHTMRSCFGQHRRAATAKVLTGPTIPDVSKPVCVFPGQGSQFPGMGRDLYDAYPIAKDIFQEADESLGWSLSEIMSYGDFLRTQPSD